jgi:hypothetical protein
MCPSAPVTITTPCLLSEAISYNSAKLTRQFSWSTTGILEFLELLHLAARLLGLALLTIQTG